MSIVGIIWGTAHYAGANNREPLNYWGEKKIREGKKAMMEMISGSGECLGSEGVAVKSHARSFPQSSEALLVVNTLARVLLFYMKLHPHQNGYAQIG